MPASPYAIIRLDPAQRAWWPSQVRAAEVWVGVFAALFGIKVAVELWAPSQVEAWFGSAQLPWWSSITPPAAATLVALAFAWLRWRGRMKNPANKRNRAARKLVQRADTQIGIEVPENVLCEVLARSCGASLGTMGRLNLKRFEAFEKQIGRSLPRVWIVDGCQELFKFDAGGGATQSGAVSIHRGSTCARRPFRESGRAARLWRRFGLDLLLGPLTLGGSRKRSRHCAGGKRWSLDVENGMAALVKRTRSGRMVREVSVDRGALVVIGREVFDLPGDNGSSPMTESVVWRFFEEAPPRAFDVFDVPLTPELPWWRPVRDACAELGAEMGVEPDRAAHAEAEAEPEAASEPQSAPEPEPNDPCMDTQTFFDSLGRSGAA